MKRLNVITRTSGRPNFFKFCKERIDEQTHTNLNHIVIIDEKNDNNGYLVLSLIGVKYVIIFICFWQKP